MLFRRGERDREGGKERNRERDRERDWRTISWCYWLYPGVAVSMVVCPCGVMVPSSGGTGTNGSTNNSRTRRGTLRAPSCFTTSEATSGGGGVTTQQPNNKDGPASPPHHLQEPLASVEKLTAAAAAANNDTVTSSSGGGGGGMLLPRHTLTTTTTTTRSTTNNKNKGDDNKNDQTSSSSTSSRTTLALATTESGRYVGTRPLRATSSPTPTLHKLQPPQQHKLTTTSTGGRPSKHLPAVRTSPTSPLDKQYGGATRDHPHNRVKGPPMAVPRKNLINARINDMNSNQRR